MSTISLCMIVKNEEAVLARCLESVRDLVDEIVLVDTGSTDHTKGIAARYTNRIYDFPWRDDFAAARNFSFEQASMDYCLWLDADDLLLPADREKFRAMKETLLPQADVVMLPYHTAFDSEGRPTFSYYRERVVRNDPRWRWRGAVHEAITPSGLVLYAAAAVTHRKEGPGYPDRNLRIFEGLLTRGQALEPREQFYYGRELFYHQRYEEAVQVLSAFLGEKEGWVENQIEACRVLSRCLTALGRDGEALRALLRSLAYDLPRAEVCCEVGAWWFRREDWRRAAYWYELALACRRDDASGAFVSPDCYGYLPCIQLCVCRWHLGDREGAAAWNERAGQYKPRDPAYLSNRDFFARGELPGGE